MSLYNTKNPKKYCLKFFVSRSWSGPIQKNEFFWQKVEQLKQCSLEKVVVVRWAEKN